MMAQHKEKRNLPGPKPRRQDAPWMGYSEAARQLGVSTQHLRAVVIGERRSKRLMRRYRAYLLTEKAKQKTLNGGAHA